MNHLAALAVATGATVLSPCSLDGDETPYVELDYSKLEREIAREPEYVAEPRYALFVFGPKGDARMWAVLDKSDAELAYYDTLYFDLDANGDLTDEGERFRGEYRKEMEPAGVAMSIWVPKVPVPGTELVHEKLRISTVGKKKDSPGVWFQMQWNGEEEISGGYGAASPHLTNWADSPAKAPVLRPTPRGTFSFGLYTWGAEEWTLSRGKDPKVYVMIGNAGSGPDTLAVMDEEFLDLEEDVLTVTLIGEDEDGEEVRSPKIRLKQHC